MRKPGIAPARIALAVALLGTISLNIWLAVTQSNIAAEPPASENRPMPKAAEFQLELEKHPVAAFEQTRIRPVFSPARRTNQQLPVAGGDRVALASPHGMKLLGVSLIGISDRRALIHFPGQNRGDWVRSGAVAHGWTVQKISAGSVVLVAGQARHELTMYAKNGAN